MSQMILEVVDGAEFELILPPPVEIELKGVGAQGPAGVDPSDIGDINDLETEDKSSLVNAINEVNMTGVNLALLYENAKAG